MPSCSTSSFHIVQSELAHLPALGELWELYSSQRQSLTEFHPVCGLAFNKLKCAPSISGDFFHKLYPLLYSVPQFPAVSASPKSDLSPQLSSTCILCSSSPSLCCYLKSTSQQKVRVIIALTSFVFSLIGITTLCCLYSKQNVAVSYISSSFLFVYSICYSILAEADSSNLSFLLHPIPCSAHTKQLLSYTLLSNSLRLNFFPCLGHFLLIQYDPTHMPPQLWKSSVFSREVFFLLLCLYSILFTHTTAFISTNSICMSPH